MFAKCQMPMCGLFFLVLIASWAGPAHCQEDAPAPRKIAAPGADFSYVGKVVKVNGATITIHSFRGVSGIIRDEITDEKTQFERNGKAAKLEDFKEGDWIKVSWNQNPKRIVRIESTKALWDEKPAAAEKF
ncbi:MAG TPA: hypothetical protein VEK08_18830 [Planctomycetota bacterium]|nr:hypothetical protein [Planctomycetota bacterium]